MGIPPAHGLVTSASWVDGARCFGEHAQDRNVGGSDVQVDFEAVAERWMITLASCSLYSTLYICFKRSTIRQIMRGLLTLYVFNLRLFC